MAATRMGKQKASDTSKEGVPERKKSQQTSGSSKLVLAHAKGSS